MKKRMLFFVLPMVWLVGTPGLRSGMNQDQSRAELGKAVAESKVSLGSLLSCET